MSLLPSPYRQYAATPLEPDSSVVGQLFYPCAYFSLTARVQRKSRTLRFAACCARCKKTYAELGDMYKFHPIFDDKDYQGVFWVLLCKECFRFIQDIPEKDLFKGIRQKEKEF